jgi:hypothetical protein
VAVKKLILLLICFSFSLCFAQVKTVQLFSIGIKVFPSSNDVRFYAETSFWTLCFCGVDTGIEIGVKSVELYGEAQVGMGVLGYSHGLYYRFPYSANNHYGWRGKLWAGLVYYASIDFDYTKNEKGFGMFASLPAAFIFVDYDDFCRKYGLYCEE